MTRFTTAEREHRWVIGSYKVLSKLSVQLREDVGLAERVRRAGVRFGEREASDKKEERFYDGTPHTAPLAKMAIVQDHSPDPGNQGRRRSDRNEGFREYWARMRLQAHHIVEDNLVKKLELDGGEFAHACAPCVLLSAELHQRLFSAGMSNLGLREEFHSEMDTDTAMRQLNDYKDWLYDSVVAGRASLLPVKLVAGEIILEIETLLFRRDCLRIRANAAGLPPGLVARYPRRNGNSPPGL